MTAHILGIDGGLATFGMAVVKLCPGETDENNHHIEYIEVVTTKPSPKKFRIHSADDTLRRVREVNRRLRSLVAKYKPALIAVEQFSQPRSASASAKMAMAYGLVIATAEFHDIPLVQVPPQEVKRVLCRKKSASKAEVERAVKKHFARRALFDRNGYLISGLTPVNNFEKQTTASKREHGFDAAGVAIVALESDMVRTIRSMISPVEGVQA